MDFSQEVIAILQGAKKRAEKNKYEFITPEGLLLEMTFNDTFSEAFEELNGSVQDLGENLTEYLGKYLDKDYLSYP